MQSPPQISWEHIDPSDFIKARIDKEIASLEKTFGRIVSCQVFIEGRGGRRRKGDLYAVRVRLELPGGKDLHASRNPPADHAHEDAYVALRDVFRALRRQLRDYTEARRDKVQQAHDTQPHGIVSKLFADEGYGFIRADDGREIYFHRNALLDDDFSRLRVGAEVRFAEEEGEKGPQASTVRAFGVGAHSGEA